jgi:hypothetical protein
MKAAAIRRFTTGFQVARNSVRGTKQYSVFAVSCKIDAGSCLHLNRHLNQAWALCKSVLLSREERVFGCVVLFFLTKPQRTLRALGGRSAAGSSHLRRFAPTQQFSRFRSEADIQRASPEPGRAYRRVFVEETMMKIIVLVALTFALIALADRGPTKNPDAGGAP